MRWKCSRSPRIPCSPTTLRADHDWGYDPVQLFAIKSKYGTPQEFKEFVKQCHQRQIAVIVDVVYNHLVDNNLLEWVRRLYHSGDSRRNLSVWR